MKFHEFGDRNLPLILLIHGGDSDTLAAITGSIAEAAYGIPDWIKDKAYTYLDEPLKDVLSRWEQEVSIT